jgi:hypothetical protein
LYGEGEIVRELEMRGKGEGGGKWFTKMKSEDHFMLHIAYFPWPTENIFGLTEFSAAPNT